jgi:hypothetical protein
MSLHFDNFKFKIFFKNSKIYLHNYFESSYIIITLESLNNSNIHEIVMLTSSITLYNELHCRYHE